MENNNIEDIERDFLNKINNPKLEVSVISKYPLKYNYGTDSGFDLYSDIDSFTLKPLERKLVPTSTFIDIPLNYELQVRPKSGRAIKEGLGVLNSPGTVDNGYTDEIKVILVNFSNSNIVIEKGQKVAQGVLSPVLQGKFITFKIVDKINDKDRNFNGFGSTGLR